MTTNSAGFKSAATFVNNAFDQIISAPTASADTLHIVGGVVKEQQLNDLLKAWADSASGKFSWVMMEDVDQFLVQKAVASLDTLIQNTSHLDRLRLFGETGDLDIRRNNAHFHWRYIGDKYIEAESVDLPDLTAFSANDFWQTSGNANLEFREVTQNYYQWRGKDERVNAHWYAATGLPEEGVCLQQKHYLQNGRIAFVRYISLEEEGENNG